MSYSCLFLAEYTFGGGSGIFNHEPKAVPNAKLRESIFIGEITGSNTVDGSISELRGEYLGSSYNILTKNCNHFSDSLVQRLTGRPIPSYVNRLAEIGGCFSCLFPPSMLGQAPVNDGSSTSPSSFYGAGGGRRVNSLDMRSSGGAVGFNESKGFKLGGKRNEQLFNIRNNNYNHLKQFCCNNLIIKK